MMHNFKDSDNPMIIWMAENYYASFQNREIDFQQIESDIFDEEMNREKQPLSF